MKKIILLLLLSVSFIYANIGKITALKGNVSILRDNGTIVGKVGSNILKEDKIKTGNNARAQIVFKDNTIISLGKKSTFSIKEYLFEAKKPVKASFNFGTGVFKTITGKIGKINPKKFTLKTKSATIGIRGTIVGLTSTPEGDKIVIPQGKVVVETPDGVANVDEGQMTEVKKGEPPVVQDAPKEEMDKMDEESGAKENEAESGQGEATQTKALTKKEKEESAGQGGVQGDTPEDAPLENPDASGPNIDPIEAPEPPEKEPIKAPEKEPIKASKTETTVTGHQLSFFGGSTGLIDNNSHKVTLSNDKLTFSVLDVNGGTLEVYPYDSSDGLDKYSTGMNNNNTMLLFKKTNNSNSVSHYYTILEDAKKEFIIGYENVSFDFGEGESPYKELFYAGINASTDDIEDKVYVYKDKAQLEAVVDSDVNLTTSSQGKELYVNGKTKSVHFLNVSEAYSTGTLDYNAGYVSGDDASISMKNISIDLGAAKYASLTGSGAVYGSELQGMGISVSGTEKTDGVSKASNTLIGLYLDIAETAGEASIKSGNYGDSSNNNRLTGYSSTYDTATVINDAIYINVDRDDGSIAANFNNSATNLSAMTFGGNVAAQTSYYINDDMWGVVGTSGTSNGYSLESDTSFMIALPDKITISSNTITALDSYDDESSWGYWTAGFNDGESINTSSTWVAGIKTAESYVQGLINDTTRTKTLRFDGHVIGSIKTVSNGVQAIKVDSTNRAQFELQLGINDNLAGKVEFQSTNASFNFNVDNVTPTASGFTATSFTSNISGKPMGTMNGSFYGTDSIKSVGGSLDITNSAGDKAAASFKATNTDITGTTVNLVSNNGI